MALASPPAFTTGSAPTSRRRARRRGVSPRWPRRSCRDTDGEFRLDVYPESRLGPDPQMFADLRGGKLEFYLSGALLGGVAPTSALPLMPFVFRDSAAVFAALDGALGDRIRGEIADAGLYAFRRSWQNGFHHITTDVRPIRTAADFAGLKIRTPGGDIAADFFRTLGAEAGMVPFSGMYDALKAKTFDGQSDPLGVVQSLRLYEVQRYLSLTAHWWTGFTLLANAEAWQALAGGHPRCRRTPRRRVRAAAARRYRERQRRRRGGAGACRNGRQHRRRRQPARRSRRFLRPLARPLRPGRLGPARNRRRRPDRLIKIPPTVTPAKAEVRGQPTRACDPGLPLARE